MEITRKDIGYTIYSRLEEALRSWVRDSLLRFGNDWRTQIPPGIWEKVENKSTLISQQDAEDPADILEETDLPDIAEIVCYQKQFTTFVDNSIFSQKDFQETIGKIYRLRCQIAHVKSSFNAIDLDLLIELSNSFLALLDQHADELKITLECLKLNPSKVVIYIPADFLLEGDFNTPYLHNLPPSDYDPDGGFGGSILKIV